MKYRANLTGVNNFASDYKFDSCILTISVGQVVHEGEKFKATLDLINKRFKKCTIGVCDTLQRHTMSIFSNELQVQDLWNLSEQAGDQWLDRNIDYCNDILDIPFNIVRWQQWLNGFSYKDFRTEVDNLYQKDTAFVGIIEKLALNFTERLIKRESNFNQSRAIALSTEYLLEECAAMCYWYKEGYSVEIYPSVRNDAIEYCFSKTVGDQYAKLVLPAGLSFKKVIAPAEEVIQEIFDNIPGHIYWKDKNGVFIGCNKKQAESYGFKHQNSIIGKKDTDFLKNDIAKRISENDQKIIDSKLESIVEEETFVSDSSRKRIKKTFLSHKIPLLDKKGNIKGLVGVSVDITTQKLLENTLLKKTKQLSLALDHKKEFLNILSHEIRTPLHIMGSIIEELYKRIHEFSKEEINSFMDALYSNQKRLMQLVTHLLESAKTIKGQSVYTFKQENIVNTCSNSIKEFHKLADIEFVCKFDELMISYDELKVSQVIRNLIDNAIKYGKDNKIKLSVSLMQDAKNLLVEVENNGELKENQKSKLFEMFFQGEEAKKMQKGVGLGLYICYEIIDRHNGKIWMDDSKHQKVIIKFTIPYILDRK